jgi:hypothetical protein
MFTSAASSIAALRKSASTRTQAPKTIMDDYMRTRKQTWNAQQVIRPTATTLVVAALEIRLVPKLEYARSSASNANRWVANRVQGVVSEREFLMTASSAGVHRDTPAWCRL